MQGRWAEHIPRRAFVMCAAVIILFGWVAYSQHSAQHTNNDTISNVGTLISTNNQLRKEISRLHFVENRLQKELAKSSNPDGKLIRSTATRCPDNFHMDWSYSKSQNNEDKYLLENFLPALCNGLYVELGALNGVKYSNSHLYSHLLDYHGVLIEPTPSAFQELTNNRPKDHLVNSAVCAQPGRVHFVDMNDDAVHGIWEFMSPSFRARWHNDVDLASMPKIACQPLTAILDQSPLAGIHIDFLSLDVEGAELEVIKTLDLSRHQFGVIFYEADDQNPQKDQDMKVHLEKRGYPFKKHVHGSNWHINAKWQDIYKGLL